jgi:hypothetical protein
MVVVVGVQLVAFGFFTKVFAVAEGLLPENRSFSRLFCFFTLEKGIVSGLGVLIAGLVLLVRAVWIWQQAGYGILNYADNLHRLIPAVTLVVLGVQVIFSSFL